MFVRLTTLHVKPESVEEGIVIYENSVIPADRAQKGFVSTYLLVVRPTGKGLAVAFWETEEDALANERSLYYQEQIIKFVHLLVTAPIREGYEVALQG